MSLITVEGFDHYVTADIAKKGWSVSACTIGITNGRRGNGGLSPTIGSGYIKKALPVASTYIMGFAMWVNVLPANTNAIAVFFDGVQGQSSIALGVDGRLLMYSGNGATLVGTSVQALQLGAWNYFEWKVTIANSAAANSCVLKVNGVNWINVAAGTDMQPSTSAVISSVALAGNSTNSFGIGSNVGTWLDDVYICDTSGTTNNDFLGDIRVDTLYPNADGAFSAWTPSAVNGAHRYWRLYVDAVLGGTVIALTELGLSLTSGGATVTTGGTASANSVSSGLAANAFDGNSGTWWGTASSQVPGWIAYDFGAGVTKNIKGFSLTSQNSASYAQTAPTQFQLQFSDDGVVWTTLVVASAPTWTQNETKVFSADLTGAAHSGMVNDPIPNLTNYNYALTIGLRDSYAFQDLPSLVSSTVYGVQVNAAMLKDDAGNKQVALFTRASGGENTDGATVALGTSQTYVSQIFEKNLNGTADWTQATVNSAEFGVKVVV